LEISHVWFYQDKQMAKINLPVKAKTWRTWSAKTIMQAWKGNWRVEVQDSKGNIISSKSFRLK
jgi:subtilisin-like proprotein convertase family protein